MKIYIYFKHDLGRTADGYKEARKKAKEMGCYKFLVSKGIVFDEHLFSSSEMPESEFYQLIQGCFEQGFDLEIEHVREKKEHFDYDVILRICEKKMSDGEIWKEKCASIPYENDAESEDWYEKYDEKRNKEHEMAIADLEKCIADIKENGNSLYLITHVKDDCGLMYTVRTTLSYPWPG
jgi:hypothetical protein